MKLALIFRSKKRFLKKRSSLCSIKRRGKKIYYEFDEADYRASEKADKIYPIEDPDWNKMAGHVFKQRKYEEQVLVKLRKQIMLKYKLTQKEAENIETEARLDRWPKTNHYYLYAHTWKEDYGKKARDGSPVSDDREK